MFPQIAVQRIDRCGDARSASLSVSTRRNRNYRYFLRHRRKPARTRSRSKSTGGVDKRREKRRGKAPHCSQHFPCRAAKSSTNDIRTCWQRSNCRGDGRPGSVRVDEGNIGRSQRDATTDWERRAKEEGLCVRRRQIWNRPPYWNLHPSRSPAAPAESPQTSCTEGPDRGCAGIYADYPGCAGFSCSHQSLVSEPLISEGAHERSRTSRRFKSARNSAICMGTRNVPHRAHPRTSFSSGVDLHSARHA
jgi:hypothetical protein